MCRKHILLFPDSSVGGGQRVGKRIDDLSQNYVDDAQSVMAKGPVWPERDLAQYAPEAVFDLLQRAHLKLRHAHLIKIINFTFHLRTMPYG